MQHNQSRFMALYTPVNMGAFPRELADFCYEVSILKCENRKYIQFSYNTSKKQNQNT